MEMTLNATGAAKATTDEQLTAAPSVSTRTLDDGRVEARFIGRDDERLLISHYLPDRPGPCALVICPSIHHEAVSNDRREFQIATSASQQAYPATRFHYRGTGHSDGELLAIDLESMIEDAVTAGAALREASGAAQVVYLGTRLGAVIAAGAAARTDAAGIVLWEPVISADSYYRDVFRARRIARMASMGAIKSKDPAAALERDGSVDVMGYSLGIKLRDSMAAVTLTGLLGSRAWPMLVVQLSRTPKLRADLEAFIEEARGHGSAVDAAVIGPNDPGWWLSQDPWRQGQASPDDELIERTMDWLHSITANGDPR
jgi:alpha/beta superfamily hydrolase